MDHERSISQEPAPTGLRPAPAPYIPQSAAAEQALGERLAAIPWARRGASGEWEPPGAGDQAVQVAQARVADPQNLDLRDQEHRLFSQHVLDQYGPVLGSLVVGASVPSYSALKAAAQANPQLGALLSRLTGYDLANATPASWREVHAGLAPVVDMLKQAWRGR